MKNYLDINILLVEDELNILNSLRVAFKPMFRNVFVATNGQKAKEILDTCVVDVIITDMNMPCMNGAELIKHVRGGDLTMPIIVTTGYNGFEEVYENMLNIQVYKKPIDIIEIYSLILSYEDDIIKFRKAKDSFARLEEVSTKAKEILAYLKSN